MFRKTTYIALILAFIVIVLGSYTRSSNAGLGCPDFPTCFGEIVVGNDAAFVDKVKAEFPKSILNITKAWKEMSYRYVAGLFGFITILLALFSWTQKQCRFAAIFAGLSTLSLFALHVVSAYWAVILKLMPLLVAAHVLVGFLMYWQLYWLRLRLNPETEKLETVNGPVLLARFAMLVVLLQVFLGTWMSSNNAGIACADFPKCNGNWMPVVDYLRAFNLFSGFDTGYTGVLSFDGQVAVHWAHRLGAIISFVVLTCVMLSATSDHYSKQIRKAGVLLSVLLLLQVILGIFSIKLALPTAIAVLHNGVAALLMLPLISISFYSRYRLKEELLEQDSVVIDGTATEVIAPASDTADVIEDSYVEPTAESLYLRLKTQLGKTRTGLSGAFSNISFGQKGIDQALLEQIESSLLMADIGIDATTEIIAKLTESLDKDQLKDAQALEIRLKEILLELLQPSSQPFRIPQQDGPFVILVVGINGVGKTTTIGKLAKRLQVQGHSVMLAAGDTFRAAAVEQLQTWGDRNKIHVVAQHTGADSASVIYDGVQSAQAKGIDVLIADTAGRLHTKSNLMEELSKIKRIMTKVDASAPHEVLLVLDAGTGQNALSQTKIFNESVELTGLALTKLDGTAKGGVIFALARRFDLPIRFIGVGEGIDDLQDFDAKSFIEALFVKD